MKRARRVLVLACVFLVASGQHEHHHEAEKHHEHEKEKDREPHEHEKEKDRDSHHHEHKIAPPTTSPPVNATPSPAPTPTPAQSSAPIPTPAQPHVNATLVVEDGAAANLINGTTASKDPDALEDFLQAFFGCFFVILATEVGDKTFFIAAILTMRHPRLAVWSGAMAALALMTVLSAVVGHAAPLLLPPSITHYAAVALFLLFGVKMLRESREASGGVSDELEEVEQELAPPAEAGPEDEPLTEDTADDASAVDGGGEAEAGSMTPAEGASARAGDGLLGAASPIVAQAFTLTFVAEWGDRSQIATIAMGADQDLIGVTLGGILGHACCTSLAVVGGKLLATRISEQTVLTLGGSLFLFFAALESLHGPGD